MAYLCRFSLSCSSLPYLYLQQVLASPSAIQNHVQANPPNKLRRERDISHRQGATDTNDDDVVLLSTWQAVGGSTLCNRELISLGSACYSLLNKAPVRSLVEGAIVFPCLSFQLRHIRMKTLSPDRLNLALLNG